MWPDDDGNWDLGNAWEEPRTSSTIPTDLATASQGVRDSGVGSFWNGLLGVAGKVVDYSLSKDAAKTQAQLQLQRQTALSTQPLVSSTGTGVAINPMGLILIGGIALAVVLATRKG